MFGLLKNQNQSLSNFRCHLSDELKTLSEKAKEKFAASLNDICQ